MGSEFTFDTGGGVTSPTTGTQYRFATLSEQVQTPGPYATPQYPLNPQANLRNSLNPYAQGVYGPSATVTNLTFKNKFEDNSFVYQANIRYQDSSGTTRNRTMFVRRSSDATWGPATSPTGAQLRGQFDNLVIEGGRNDPGGTNIPGEVFDRETAYDAMQPLISYFDQVANGSMGLTEHDLITAIGHSYQQLGERGADASWREAWITDALTTYDQILSANTGGTIRLGGISTIMIPTANAAFGQADSGHTWIPGSGGLILKDGQQVTDAADQTDGLPTDWPGFPTGSTVAQYRAPDRRVIEDLVRGQLKLKVGLADEGRTQILTDLYMGDHRRNYDSKDKEIDPGQSVIESIRQYDDYVQIHKNRPKDADEDGWLSSAIANFRGQGLNEKQARREGIRAAGRGDISVEASQIDQSTTGNSSSFFDKAASIANVIGRSVK